MVKKICVTALATLMLVSSSAMAVTFTDISGHWAEQSIITLADKGVVDGVTDTTFVPDGTVTRAQYLKMIMEATGVKLVKPRAGECLEVGVNEWYATYLQTALDAGLVPNQMIAGYKEKVEYTVDDNGTATDSKVVYHGAFNGNLPITREEMAVLTEYVFQYTRTILTNEDINTSKIKPFTDYDSISDWAQISVKRALVHGFMDGMDNNMFNPKDTATRAQSATVILRVLNKVGA